MPPFVERSINMSEKELARILQTEADEAKVQKAINEYLKGETE